APVAWSGPPNVAPEEWVELAGSTQPLPGAVARVAAPIDGRIDGLLQFAARDWQFVNLREGDEVKANAPIARLDDRIALLNLEKAEAALGSARSALNLANAQLASQQELQKKSPALVPDIQIKTAQAAAEDAQAKQTAAEKDVATLKAQLGFCTLRAPIHGRLGRVMATIGQPVTAGAEVAEIINIEDEIDVLCFVSQHDAASLQVGQPADLGGFDPWPGEIRTDEQDGSVVYVSDKAEPESGCFVVKVRFHNSSPHPHLRGDIVQRVRVQTRTSEQAADLLGEKGVVLQEQWLIEDHDPPSVVIVEDIKIGKDDEGKPQETGTAKRLSATVVVRDRLHKLVGVTALMDEDRKAYPGPLDKLKFVTKGAQGLETGDPVRLQAKEED
ncbi:MAG TPA: efflux RND transporter periplasmic adaptor subunit, partial [Gemmataceae bacterium]|nr:efflux RND transporter periplasmic adaptor subunit [Gemmataceae bacterium]